ncbi:hypothetical protein [Chryseobacterium sp.]|uniref:hypothetical protein n=1 Tax=Chryseobacterium sp. TaxID=1871047 RepID=UPI00289AA88C|nr:hypothetical protein [Chryseobacterium sp.]
MNKTWITYFLIFIPVLFYSQIQTQTTELYIPGKSSSVSFNLENESTADRNFTTEIQTSDASIVSILQNNTLHLSNKERRVFLVPVKISAETKAGKYTIDLILSDTKSGEKIQYTEEIRIARKKEINLELLEASEFVKAGDSFTTKFILKNIGNTSEKLILESKEAVLDLKDNKLTLQPGESRIVSVIKNTNISQEKIEIENISLTVASAELLSDKLTSYSTTTVIPVKPITADIYHRLPVYASFSFVGMQNRGEYQDGFQGEISGKGSLTESNNHLIEFRALSKNPVEFNSFTQYEEYFVNYKYKFLRLHLGDKNYTSSFLTDYARYGRGAEINFDFNKVSFGGYYTKPRFFRDITEEFNVYSKYKIRENSFITAGYLYKVFNPRQQNSPYLYNSDFAHLPYLNSEIELTKNLKFSGEYSFSKGQNSDGTAFMVQTQANFKFVSGNVMYTKASPQYLGYFNNTDMLNANLQVKISKNLSLMGNYTKDAKNFQRDTLFLAAPLRNYLSYGLSYRYSKTGSITVNNGFQRYKDRLEPRQFDYSENFYRLSVNQNIGIFQISADGQIGRTENFLNGFTGTSSFYSANVGFEKFKTSFNIYGSYSLTSRYQEKNQQQIFYGARIMSRFSDKSFLSIFYQNNYLPEEYYKDRNLFELVYQQKLSKNHIIDFAGRYTLQRGDIGKKDFLYSVKYTLMLNIPVQKTAEYASLSGNIKNLGVEKVSGIKLMLGTYLSVSDARGNFEFKNIPPGDYFLEIDRTSLPLDYITDRPTPVQITLVSDRDNIFNFGLTKASGIKGKINFTDHSENKSISKKPNESLILEVKNGEDVVRKMVKIGEMFSFTYLRPGEYNVKVYRNGLDSRFKISQDLFAFEISAEETKDISINISKKQTDIKFQKESLKVTYNDKKASK